MEADRPLSPDELLGLAQARVGGLSLATIYRNISSLVEDRWLAEVAVPGGAMRYEVAGKAHHHHFQCRGCGTLHELEGCELRAKPKLPVGFEYASHELFVYGTCAACMK